VFIFAGAKFGEIVLKWDAFNYATKFRAMAIYVILFEREIIIRGLHKKYRYLENDNSNNDIDNWTKILNR
jgi:hypothetical protein